MIDVSFLHPALLSALALLPLLAWWLRAAPPPPQIVPLPTFHFIAGLSATRPTPRTLPWWLLFLRLVVAALIILALADPIQHPTEKSAQNGPLRLILDTSWASAPSWETIQATAHNKIDQAERENRSIDLATTAAPPGTRTPIILPHLTAAEARAHLEALTPSPWPGDLETLLKKIPSSKEKMETIWLGSGLEETGMKDLMERLSGEGPVTYLAPSPENTAMLLRPDTEGPEGTLAFRLDISRPSAKDRSTRLTLSDANGRVITHLPLTLPAGETSVRAAFPPTPGERPPARVQLDSAPGVGTTYLLSGLSGSRTVALIAPAKLSDTAPLTTAGYYITRALKPYAMVENMPLAQALEKPPQVIIAPDLDTSAPQDVAALTRWVEKGGVLLRFAGKQTLETGSMDRLLPVPLQGGERTLDGLTRWKEPPLLAPFPEESPFAGLPPPTDIHLKQQALARPTADLSTHTWAALADGTPWISARAQGAGWLILVHTRADPAGSDLPLSGFYLTLLKTVLAHAGQTPATGEKQSTKGTITPLTSLNAFGLLTPALETARPLAPDAWNDLIPGPDHPPGLYRQGGRTLALNLGDRLPSPSTVGGLPTGVKQENYETETTSRSFKPLLLALALALMALDAMALWLLGGRRLPRLPYRRVALLTLCLIFPPPANAQENPSAAGGVPLACVQTPAPERNQLCQKALSELAQIVRTRTAIETGDISIVRPEKDDLSLYPLLVWPLREDDPDLTAAQTAALRAYLDHGGLLFIDTGDGSSTATPLPTAGARKARLTLRTLGYSDLTPLSAEHVLQRSFYLLDRIPGALDGATLWIAQQDEQGQDGVSPVIWGSHDWLPPWAEGIENGMVRGRDDDQELAFRFGINVLMYALTGNYKTDQVHLPFIMQRLGDPRGDRP